MKQLRKLQRCHIHLGQWLLGFNLLHSRFLRTGHIGAFLPHRKAFNLFLTAILHKYVPRDCKPDVANNIAVCPLAKKEDVFTEAHGGD
jgi:hypothetical protein